ncbi:serine-threonine protein kinase 19-domain-containing protein [Parachaetomium inaequale]|uniref:Serine-threonine protein kinase 19-domain-containing protein n=1 Tax=Parachaetomium inaequale TaxID=2588326 RepID=A0AAN6PKB6_9PEZI|nr:serine-threonine protein kinase 19-domain-containing protein [Parachaetomium inaequale]
MTLRSILGGSRVKKRSSSSTTKRTASPTASSWTASLARTKPGTTTPSKSNNTNNRLQTKLQDHGPATPLLPPSLLHTHLQVPTPLQIHHLILTTMFDPLPPQNSGLGSARTASVLQFRAAVPPVVSVSHFQSLLLAAGVANSPAAAERAMAGLVREGKGRKVVIPTLRAARAGGGELFVLSRELEGLVNRCEGLLGDGVGERFVGWLRGNPGRGRMEEGEGALGRREVDGLVRAGFLTAVNESGTVGGLRARPEERYVRISLETVARAAAGSVAAAGGEGVLHAAGGTGARSMVGPVGAGAGAGTGAGAAAGGFSVAVPGSGVFLKLVSAALEHLADLLRKTQYREMSESDLREKWDGGIVGDSEVALAKKTRGEFTGVMPGRTKKWKEFQGLAFDWVLREAAGAGIVEVFETRSVGRGVRLV